MNNTGKQRRKQTGHNRYALHRYGHKVKGSAWKARERERRRKRWNSPKA